MIDNRWDNTDNWIGNSLPSAGDNAFFSGTLGTGGTVRFTGGGNFTANVATITINSPPARYTDFNTGTASTASATINFGSTAAGLTYAHNDTGTTAFQFYIGRNRATSGIITTSFDNLLNVRVRRGQRLSLNTTLVGSGSISLQNNGSTSFTLDHHAAHVLGAGDQASDGSLSTSNTFSGGVSVGALSFLLLGESSVVDGGGSVTSGPVGTGTLTIGGTATDTARIGAIRSGTITSGASLTLHNRAHVDGAVQVVGGIDMNWAGTISFATGSSVSVSPNAEGLTNVLSTLTLSGQLFNGFEKRGPGTLNLAHNNGALLVNQIQVTNGVLLVSTAGALGSTGAGNETVVSSGGTLRFADGLTYGGEEIAIAGDGFDNTGAIRGGETGAATFGGTIRLTANANIDSGPTAGGLMITGVVDFGTGSGFRIGKLGNATTSYSVGTLTLLNPTFADTGTDNAIVLQPNSGGATALNPLAIDIGSGTTVLPATIRGSNGTSVFAGLLTKLGAGTLQARSIRVEHFDLDNGTLRIADEGGSAGTSRVGSININTSNSAKLDLRDNDLIIDYTGSSPLNDLQTLIQSGFNSSAWNGPGIMTSLGDASFITALGYAEASAVLSFGGGSLATYNGITLDNTSVIVKYTYFGDANLDGMVDVNDLAAVATYWQTTGEWWHGDFDFSDFVDINDLARVATNWQLGVGGPRFGGGMTLYEGLSFYPDVLEAALNDPYLSNLLGTQSSAAVPEPAVTFGLLIVLFHSRNRHRHRDATTGQ